ncbi:MAG: hypothetical protein ACI8RN_002241, partial [Glaciecola sp.]
YVVMLGDDDALLEGYCDRLRRLVAEYSQPDCIYLGAYLFTYPGVIPGKKQGMLNEARNAIFWRSGRDQYLLDSQVRLRLVNDAMHFYNSYGFNMQFVALHRDIIKQLSKNGEFYRSPYPDYYAMNNVMLQAQRVVVSESPLVAIGVSPNSFGWYFQNHRESAGNEHLSIDETDFAVPGVNAEDILPGTSMNTHWLMAVATLKEANKHDPRLSAPSIARYRRKQIIYFALLLANGHTDAEARASFISLLSQRERYYFLALRALIATGAGSPWLLGKLHVISQKRISYLRRIMMRRLLQKNTVKEVEAGKNILDIGTLIDDVNRK